MLYIDKEKNMIHNFENYKKNLLLEKLEDVEISNLFQLFRSSDKSSVDLAFNILEGQPFDKQLELVDRFYTEEKSDTRDSFYMDKDYAYDIISHPKFLKYYFNLFKGVDRFVYVMNNDFINSIEIPKEIGLLKNVEYLDISGRFTKLPNEINNLKKLEELKFYNLGLVTSIPRIISLPNLKTLYLTYVDVLPQLNTPNLKTFGLTIGSGIKELFFTEFYKKCSNLIRFELNLKDIEIDTIPTSLKDLKNLEFFGLWANKIQDGIIPEELAYLKNLIIITIKLKSGKYFPISSKFKKIENCEIECNYVDLTTIKQISQQKYNDEVEKYKKMGIADEMIQKILSSYYVM